MVDARLEGEIHAGPACAVTGSCERANLGVIARRIYMKSFAYNRVSLNYHTADRRIGAGQTERFLR
jgi:hypothetical protein